jgi:hypothetical protein
MIYHSCYDTVSCIIADTDTNTRHFFYFFFFGPFAITLCRRRRDTPRPFARLFLRGFALDPADLASMPAGALADLAGMSAGSAPSCSIRGMSDARRNRVTIFGGNVPGICNTLSRWARHKKPTSSSAVLLLLLVCVCSATFVSSLAMLLCLLWQTLRRLSCRIS